MKERPRPGGRPAGRIRRASVTEDVEREVRAHLALATEELQADGWDPAEAKAEALRRFGDRERVARESVRISRSHAKAQERGRMMEAVWQDVRYGLRSLVQAPAFTVVALVTLGLGIGANAAIFSVVNGVLLRSLPFDEPHELVSVTETSRTGGSMSVAWANFRDWRRDARSFEGMTAYGAGTTTVLGGPEPVWSTVAYVTEDFWTVFPVTPLAGRLTLPDDHRAGAPPVAVVTRSFAENVMGSLDVLGRAIEASGTRAEIIGVVPSDFSFPTDAEIWTVVTPQGDSRTAHNWSVVGRLREGVQPETAAGEVDALMKRIASEAVDEADDYLAVGTTTESLRERLVGSARQPLYILLGAAGFVLLVACTNLASTLLARGTVRSQEFAVRSALGAPRGRLVRQLLTESGVLALGGAVVGLAMAAGVLSVLRAVAGASVPRLDGVAIDGRVMAFTLVTAVATAVAFGLLPALRNSERAQADALRSRTRGNAGSRGRTWSFLVATEVALALMLLAGSGLLIRSFQAVLAEDPGFDPGDVALTTIAPSGIKYPALEDAARFWEDLLDRVEGAPGVAASGVISSRPLGGAPNGRLSLDGNPDKVGDGLYVVASAGTFEALDIPLVRGRLFQDSDAPGAPHAVVVSQSFAERYWPGLDPIGRLVSGGGMDDYWNADPVVFGTVVGVVGDVRYRDLTRVGEPVVYWHYKQRPFRIRRGGTLLAEAAEGDPARVAPTLRDVVRAADPDVAVDLRYLEDLVMGSVDERRFLLLVLGGFAGVALVLAGVGIYGVVSYAVAQRTREMGIRLALGAAPASVRSLVLSGALRPVALGLLLGLAGGLASSRVLGSFLYEVPATDWVTFAAVAGLLLATAVLASWVPAQRGTRVDPILAMRAE